MADIEVEQITIKIGKKQLVLSQEQANELLEVLGKLLGRPQIVEKIVEHPYPYWRWWYVTQPQPYPTWTTSNTMVTKSNYTVTMKANGNG